MYPFPIAKQTVLNKCFDSVVISDTTSHDDLSDLIKKLLDKADSNPNELGQILGELRREVAGNFIITTSVSLDEENTTRHRVYV